MDTTSIRTPFTKVLAEEKRLAKLEERYRHELMDEEGRCELSEHILRLRRRLSRQG